MTMVGHRIRNRTLVRETMSEAGRCVNTDRPLTRSTSTTAKEGLAMKATPSDTMDRQPTRFGDPRLPDRFWAKVRPVGSGCWIWVGAKAWGYGSFSWEGRTRRAHRFAYLALEDPSLPPTQVLDHLCRNRACVNPEHLEPVTTRENVLRGIAPTAMNAVKTHCPRGHEFTPDNTYIQSKGSRECRICRRAAKRLWAKRRRSR